ncbi:MAG: histidine--tRNA ligase [Candidatus Aminicenantes bacterium]|jgi:histidyl-tRNA synthetase
MSTRAKKKITAIKGTRDILPAEARKWQTVESVAREIFELYGYREIRTPVFEPTELFEKGTGETSDVVTKEMYTFQDKAGRSLTLRPEYTPSVVRAIMDHSLHLQSPPMRYYFFGPMFRYDKPQKGRYRQFHQIDIEVFGEKDAAIDAEIVEMADFLLKRLNVADTEILVNSVGCKACRPSYHHELKAAAEGVREDLCADCQRKADLNPLRIFDCKEETCRELSRAFPKITDYLCSECEEHFKRFCEDLGSYGIPYRIEPRLVRGLDYYTKTTFEIISSKLGAQDAILGGGRYDDMMKEFGGPDICGTGFAMGLERFLSVVPFKAAKETFLYIVFLGDAAKKAGMALARRLRRDGIECLIEYKDRSLKNQLSRANKLGASWVLIIGEDEVKANRYQLKNMRTGSQQEVRAEEILDLVRKPSRAD